MTTLAKVASSLLFFLLFADSSTRVSARIKGSLADHVKGIKPRRGLSDVDLSNKVFEELRRFQSEGASSTLKLPHTAVSIHRIVVEGAANEGEEFNEEARSRALTALKSGSSRFASEGVMQATAIHRNLQENGGGRDLQSAKNILGIVIFTLYITFLVVLVVTNLVAGELGFPIIPAFESPAEFLTGTPGASFSNINPCNKIPLQTQGINGKEAPKFSYLPVTGGFLTNVYAKLDVSVLENVTQVQGMIEGFYNLKSGKSAKQNMK
jgi:hypothetical protein